MDLEETRAFLAVVDNGSFKAAAEAVRQPRATLRRRVEALEARAGVVLLERSRSGVTPTAAGTLLARQGRVMVRETSALLSALRELGDEPAGELCIGAPAGLPPRVLALLCARFKTQLPKVRLHLRIADEGLGERIEHVDIALHLGRDQPPGRWHARTLMTMHESLRASRTYLQCRGVPRSIADLADHDLLAWASPGRDHQRWPTYEGGTFGIAPTLTSTDCDALSDFANLGLGVALLPTCHLSGLDPRTDELIPVLDGVVGRSYELRAVVPEALAQTPKIAAVLDQLGQITSRLHERATPARSRAGAGLQGLHLPAM